MPKPLTKTRRKRALASLAMLERRWAAAEESEYPIISRKAALVPELGALPARFKLRREGDMAIKVCPAGYAIGGEMWTGELKGWFS